MGGQGLPQQCRRCQGTVGALSHQVGGMDRGYPNSAEGTKTPREPCQIWKVGCTGCTPTVQKVPRRRGSLVTSGKWGWTGSTPTVQKVPRRHWSLVAYSRWGAFGVPQQCRRCQDAVGALSPQVDGVDRGTPTVQKVPRRRWSLVISGR